MSKSYAEIATEQQGSGNYPGHDEYQNGIISDKCDRIYIAGWGNDWASDTTIDNKGESHLSFTGYFTDQVTVDNCMKGDQLDTNQLDAAIQTKLSDVSTSSYNKDKGTKIQGDFQAHSHVSAYDIDHKRLSELKHENSELYNRLTNPDGLSPDGSEIKVAYGQAKANTQHGTGGGNQYYIDPKTFKDAEDAGVFKYNRKESFSVDGSTGKKIQRKDTSPQKYGDYDGGKYRNELMKATVADQQKMDRLAAERAVSGQSRSKQINSHRVVENPKQPYITTPDPAYYGKVHKHHVSSNKNNTIQVENSVAIQKNRHSIPNVSANGAERKSLKDNMPNKAVNNVKGSKQHQNADIPNRAAEKSKQMSNIPAESHKKDNNLNANKQGKNGGLSMK